VIAHGQPFNCPSQYATRRSLARRSIGCATYYDENVLKVIENGVRWACAPASAPVITTGNVGSLEPIHGFLRDGHGEKRDEPQYL
jgi:hypothetical protein